MEIFHFVFFQFGVRNQNIMFRMACEVFKLLLIVSAQRENYFHNWTREICAEKGCVLAWCQWKCPDFFLFRSPYSSIEGVSCIFSWFFFSRSQVSLSISISYPQPQRHAKIYVPWIFIYFVPRMGMKEIHFNLILYSNVRSINRLRVIRGGWRKNRCSEDRTTIQCEREETPRQRKERKKWKKSLATKKTKQCMCFVLMFLKWSSEAPKLMKNE